MKTIILFSILHLILSQMIQIEYPYYCKAEDRQIKNCDNQEKLQVCGWFNSSAICMDFPCATSFENACLACQNKWVSKLTLGPCPKYPPINAHK